MACNCNRQRVVWTCPSVGTRQRSETFANLDFQKTPTKIRGLPQLFYASMMRAQPCQRPLDAD